MAMSMKQYLNSNYPSKSQPEKQPGPGAGIPSFAVGVSGQTSADSTPQPEVALPSTGLPNDLSKAQLFNGSAGYQLMGRGYQSNDNLQFRSTIDESGVFSTELHDGDKPISTPYPSDPND